MAPTAHGRRLAWLDVLRGAALLGMAAYHGAWDLHAFGVIAADPSRDAAWRLLGNGVAALFLTLSGFGLSLAARNGMSGRRAVLRLGRIAAAAALVTAVTRWAVPGAPIRFGILHCIVVTNGLGLGLRRAPTPWVLAAAAAAIALPLGLPGLLGTGWSWTGLAAAEPTALDFRPVLPWLAPVLVGMVLGRHPGLDAPEGRLRVRPGWRPLAWAGRHSLLVYLCHQPLMIAVLFGLVGAAAQDDPTVRLLRHPEQAAAFLRQCRDACVARGDEAEVCASTCHCVLTSALSGSGAPQSRIVGAAIGSSRRLEAAVALCRRGSGPPAD